MESIKFIDNLFIDKNGLYALSSKGEKMKVCLRQGLLEGACVMYSLMMMLILCQKVTMEEITNDNIRKDNQFVKDLKRTFLFGKRGMYIRGNVWVKTIDKLRIIFNNKLAVEDYCIFRCATGGNKVSKKSLADTIEHHLKNGHPVQIAYHDEPYGHSVVAIGYMRKDTILRLFCIDPSLPIFVQDYWNEVIDIHICSEKSKDWSYANKCQILVCRAMFISECPF